MTARIPDLVRELAAIDRRISNLTIMLSEKQARRDAIKAELDEHVARTEPRTRFIDFDARRDPKTDRHCIMCQKDVRDGERVRHVRLVHVGAAPHAMHPEDVPRFESGRLALAEGSEDKGTWPRGADCAKRLGIEWTTA